MLLALHVPIPSVLLFKLGSLYSIFRLYNPQLPCVELTLAHVIDIFVHPLDCFETQCTRRSSLQHSVSLALHIS